MKDLDPTDVDIVKDLCIKKPEYGCKEEFSIVFRMIMTEQQLPLPKTAPEARYLYMTLLDETIKILCDVILLLKNCNNATGIYVLSSSNSKLSLKVHE